MMERNHSIEIMRVFAILSVVLGHSCIIYDPHWSVYSTPYESKFFYALKDIINSYQMQLFFAISGYLYYYTLKKTNTIWVLLKNKSQRLLLPFLFVAFFYLVPIRLLADYPLYEGGLIQAYEEMITRFDVGHLWFLPTLFICFCIGYLLKYSNNTTLGIVFLLAFIASIMTRFIHVPISIIGRSLCFFFYFCIGYVIANFPTIVADVKKIRCMKYWGVIIMIMVVALRLYLDGGIYDKVVNLLSSILIVCYCFLYTPNNTHHILSFIDKNSMGIFLFHSPVIYVIYNIFSQLQPYALVPLALVSSLFVSLAITLTIRIVGFKMLIGE